MISIILLNYNNSIHTINCLKSLQNQTFKDFEIILVEHNSNQFYREILYDFLKTNELNKDFLNKIKIIQAETNRGFTGGNNLGIHNSKGHIILLLNNDTEHESNFLEKMNIFFHKYNMIHIAQPKICHYIRKDLIWQNGGIINKYSYNLFTPIDSMKIDKELHKRPFQIDYAIGCALFIRREILEKIGLFDNIFYMYCEEVDLCYRAKIKGYNNIYCNPDTKIYHKCKFEYTDSFKRFYFRNRMIFCCKHFSYRIILLQFFMQFFDLLLKVINFKKKQVDYKFLFQSIIGIINGLNLGIRRRFLKKL